MAWILFDRLTTPICSHSTRSPVEWTTGSLVRGSCVVPSAEPSVAVYPHCTVTVCMDYTLQIQVVQLRGAALIPDYFAFQLELNYSGTVAITEPISGQAVAMQIEEVEGSTQRGRGIRYNVWRRSSVDAGVIPWFVDFCLRVCVYAAIGESMQAKLSKLPNIGRVRTASGVPYLTAHMHSISCPLKP